MAVRTSAAHLALRALLHPVFAWPLCVRSSLPLHALHRQQLLLRYLDPNFDLVIDLGNRNTNLRPPNRRHHPPRLRSALCPDTNLSLTSSFRGSPRPARYFKLEPGRAPRPHNHHARRRPDARGDRAPRAPPHTPPRTQPRCDPTARHPSRRRHTSDGVVVILRGCRQGCW